VSARELGGTFAYAPKDFVGVMDAAVDLRSANDRLMDSQVVRLEWIWKKPDMAAVVVPRREPIAPVSPAPSLDAEELATLIKRGHDFLKAGDIPSARLVLRRAANAGNAQAALALGGTYDGVLLAELGVLGFAADTAQARTWYQRALELGSPEASRRLDRLAGLER
jgi:TPR repeat protein